MLGFRKRAAALLVAAPLLLAGCGSASSSSSNPAESAAGRAGGDWILYDQGRVKASPSVRYGKASPTPSDALPTLPAASKNPAPRPSPSCTPRQNIAGLEGLGVVPGATTAVVTWYHPGGSDIVDYRVTAASQDLRTGSQAEIGWTKSAPARCGEVSATVTGLTAGTPYIFTVDVVKTRTDRDGRYAETVARSEVVSTTSG